MKSFIFLSSLITLLTGLSVEVAGIGALDIDNILASATESANNANIHQFATALELYYMENDQYPIADSGKDMINILYTEKYIRSLPLDSDDFTYQSLDNGQDYNLAVK